MDTGESLLEGLHQDPADLARWMVLADWLEDEGDPREELLRLHLALRQVGWGQGDERSRLRLLELLASGIRPLMPTRTNSLGMTFVLIPPGTFWMGSPEDEEGRYPDEGPMHPVRIRHPFYLGVYPVTQDEYSRVMGRNPSLFSATSTHAHRVRGLDTRQFPVENVSWQDACRFCESLSALAAEEEAGRRYRLPAEAEWEYACRAGASSQPFHFHSVLGPGWANHETCNGLNRPCPAGSYPPNAWGLYDTHGNVWEWVEDEVRDYRTASTWAVWPVADETRRGFRGGAFCSPPRKCRAACRSADLPDFSAGYLGFRVAMNWP